MTHPVRFHPSIEQIKPDEAETIRGLEEQFDSIQETTAKDYKSGVRAVHAKAHGIAIGRLTVAAGLPPELAQGIFSHPASFDAVIRISTNAGDVLDDAIALPRGLALKVMDVAGERLPGSENETSQDFIMVNGPVFAAPNAAAFLKNLKLLSKTTDVAEGGKKLLSSVLQGVNAALSAVGYESPTIQQMGGAPQVHPLGETYYTQTPFRYGDYIAKLSLAPVAPALTSLTDVKIDVKDRPDALREDVSRDMIEHGGRWELRVQLNTDLDKMPVEDPTIEWSEEESPFVTVATLDIEPQISWQHGTSDRQDDALSFNICRGTTSHQPLGNVNRARNDTYRRSTAFRAQVNGCPMHDPRKPQDIAAE
ncbi:catalase family protein [Novosphingobium sp. P6W]|uniref:catalase family protein n=1 Tax=Novosphingobium sp. P6W TaxID=1609758 RepID=UPI0005C2AB0A|nr:catalase family protein [Novosphingobium sp. P6W]AXB79100.1 catalase [Novosphingobium sp. P6W]KIS30420.1 catalase [Novosphingobium sp. P6W]